MRDQEVLGVVLLAGTCGRLSACGWFGAPKAQAASLLGSESAARLPLDIAAVRQRDDDLFARDQVLGGEVARRVAGDVSSALVAVFLGDVLHLLFDQHPDLLLGGQDRLQVGHQLDDLLVLLLDLVALQLREPPERHVEDGFGLPLGQPELGLQVSAGGLSVSRGPDRRDHLVQVVEGDLEALEDVGPFLRLLQLEPSAADDDVAAMVDEELEHLLQPQDQRPAIDQRE